MAAATKNRAISAKVVNSIQLPVAASAVLYGGTLGASDASGYGVPLTETTGLKVWGKVKATADNASGGNGAINVVIEFGHEVTAFLFANDTNTPVTTVGTTCYGLDNQTVSSDSTGTSAAGLVYEVTSEGVWVLPTL